MASRRSFPWGLALRLALLGAAVTLFAVSLSVPGLAVARLLAGLLVILAVWQLWRHVDRTNAEAARFVEALGHRDFSQTFTRTGSGFDRLGEAMDGAFQALRRERTAVGEDMRLSAALLEETPSALLLVDADGRVTLANKAARKLFARLGGTRSEDFAAYGADLVALLSIEGAAAKRLVTLPIDGVAQRALASRSTVERSGGRVAAIAIQPIQDELSGVELAAQADLVRVLTHEIMNSMTPVVSLAASAASLMRTVDDGRDPAIGDARLAIETLARRADGIMRFVDAYRAFARPPGIRRARFAAEPWAVELQRLFLASPAGARTGLTITYAQPDILLDGDADLLAQVVLNLLKNGAEAAADAPHPALGLAIALLPGGRASIAVEDNGPGIAPDRREEIFLPFFTTKVEGTGVGLSLARRVVAAHGGAIAVGAGAHGGARFEIVL